MRGVCFFLSAAKINSSIFTLFKVGSMILLRARMLPLPRDQGFDATGQRRSYKQSPFTLVRSQQPPPEGLGPHALMQVYCW